MKRKYTLGLILSFLLVAVKGYSYDFQSNGIYYNFLDGNNVAVTYGDTKYEGDIFIPEKSTYYGKSYRVISIGNYAFNRCSGLTSITIPNSVIGIDSRAFSDCSGLTSIVIPNSVTSIGNDAFYGCSSLTSITISNSVTSIGDYAFFGCCSLISITIPNSVTSIKEGAFCSCSSLTSITIPNSVDYIGIRTFSLCGCLTSIEVDSNNKRYDSRNNCNAIIEKSSNTLITGCKKTVIPNSVTSVGSYAFEGCSGLTSITIPNSVTSIGGSAFSGCDNLTSIEIPNSVTSIGAYAFLSTQWYNNQPDGLVYAGKVAYKYKGVMPKNTEIVIENGTLGIAATAFYGCSGLSSVTIPNSVTSIGYDAFYGCSGLSSVTIPNSVTSIESYAFSKCSGLISITIPNSVTSIGYNAFYLCSGLTSVVSEIQKPFYIADYVFSGISSGAILYVPKGTKSEYEKYSGWTKDFKEIVEINNAEISKFKCDYNKFNILQYITKDVSKMVSTDLNDIVIFSYKDDYSDLIPDTSKTVSIVGYYNNSTIATGHFVIYPEFAETYGYNNVRAIILELDKPFEQGDLKYNNGFYKLVIPEATFGDANFGKYIDPIVPNNEKPRPEECIVNGKYESFTFYVDDSNVDKNNVIITANSITREYGDENPEFTFTTSGGTLNGTPKIICSATKSSPVGTYTIKIERGSVTNSNVEYVDGTLTITKAPLTITAKSYTRKQGESNPTFDVTYSGFKNNETSSVLTRKPTCSTTATSSSAPGTYDITVSGASATNYDISYVNGKLTVTEDDQVSISYRGVTYIGQPSTLTAEVQSVYNDNLMEVEIPSSVDSNGKTYKVTSVADGAFSNRTFNYVSLPSSVTSISDNTFKNTSLGALIWNAKASLPSSVFSNMAIWTKTTFLLYVNDKSYAPLNFGNVVVGNSTYTAEKITLEDGTNTMFYCPKEFTAQSITYTHKYSLETGGKGKGWESIALPFNVQKITHASKGELTPFASYQSGSNQRPFWLMELSSSGFTRASAIKANTPYIIAMPNSTEYDDYYNIRGNVTFSANNVKVAETSSLVTRTSTSRRTSYNMTFTPAFAPQTNVYALNVYSDTNPGSEFIANQKVYPFQAYMTTNSNTRSIGIEFDNGTTDIDEIPLSGVREGRVRVYSLGGQLLINSDKSNWEFLWQRLPSGVYIVNGKKTIK